MVQRIPVVCAAFAALALATLLIQRLEAQTLGPRTEDLRVASSGGVTLAGTLYLPEGAGPFPAIVFTHGSRGIGVRGPDGSRQFASGYPDFVVDWVVAQVSRDIAPNGGAQHSTDRLLGDFRNGWRDQWNERRLASRGNDFRESTDGGSLRVRSDGSASALWRPLELSGTDDITLQWQWRIEQAIPDNTREREKAGDDYAARVFVIFEGTPFDSKSLAICYVWASREAIGATYTNPFVENVKTVVLETGNERAGQWVEERRDVVKDFEALFGRRPVTVTGVALMVDTDNTRSQALTWFDEVEVRRKP